MVSAPAEIVTTRFRFSYEPTYQRANRLFGIATENTWIDIDGRTIDAHFGRWRLHTTLANISAVEITGPYRFIKTAGPARLGITDLGITFATNRRRGVLLTFREKVAAIEPFGVLRHPELTVTVAEVDAFVKLIRERADLGRWTRGDEVCPP